MTIKEYTPKVLESLDKIGFAEIEGVSMDLALPMTAFIFYAFSRNYSPMRCAILLWSAAMNAKIRIAAEISAIMN